jgi:oxygen-independent coproporphyrinogen-3 oxidase
VKHPAAWAGRLAEGHSPAQAREVLDPAARCAERILLETRLVEGLDVAVLDGAGRSAAAVLVADGLLDGPRLAAGRVVLTRQGRLLADSVVRQLVPGRPS